MPRIAIDGLHAEVPAGGTILDAARSLGIEIPTLCFLDGYKPSTSCMVCMVRIEGSGRLVPACGTLVADGMRVETLSPEVRRARRMALELLLSDHAGDCLAPCQSICPAQMDVPTMIRQIAAGNFAAAVATVKDRIALPGILGRICTKPCEKGCRRGDHGGAVSVCLLKQSVADQQLTGAAAHEPARSPPSGKRAAIIGSGPTGLAAAFYLLQWGHSVAILDDHPEAGGALRYSIGDDRLPRWVLDGEVEAVRRLGAELRLGTRVGETVTFDALRAEFDAVLIATGELDGPSLARLGLPGAPKAVSVDRKTFRMPVENVFAAGGVLRKSRLAVRSVAEGRAAATSIDQLFRGLPATGPEEEYNHRLLTITDEEILELTPFASLEPRNAAGRGDVLGFTVEEAQREAARCVGCDCRKLADCRLRRYATEYGAEQNRFRGARRRIEVVHQEGGVIFESGKCISCGICIQIAAAAREPLGLTFIGRGFDVRLGVPFDRRIEEGLQKVAAECIAACPTGALAFADRIVPGCGSCGSSGIRSALVLPGPLGR